MCQELYVSLRIKKECNCSQGTFSLESGKK